jgi:hypothetical protein
VIMLAEARKVGVADDNVNVGNGEAAAVMDELAYSVNRSQAPSWSCSGANCSSTHFAVEKYENKREGCYQIRIFTHVVNPRGGGLLRSACRFPVLTHIMSFQDIESGPTHLASSFNAPHKREEAEKPFLTLQHALSLQIFKINANVQGILKLVDQLGTSRDSSSLRKSLCVSSLIN